MNGQAGPRFYVAASRRGPRESGGLHALALWTQAEVWLRRPLPADRPGLVLTATGPRLHVPGEAPRWWHPNFTTQRLQAPHADLLVRALDLRPGESVIDGTLGFGYDAMVLAAAGARVLGLEALGIVAWFTLDGLWRHARPLARHITARRADHATWLASASPASVDHVYLDPPFPDEDAGSTPTFTLLRSVAPCRRPDAALVADALRVARRRVIVKLAPTETPPAGAGLPPPEVVWTRRLRYAVWRHHAAA